MKRVIRSIAIMGATAVGKSELAVTLAQSFDGEVVSMDSRQVYRGFDVGTGKLSPVERARVPHHLIDVADAEDAWSAGRHATLAERTVREVAARGRVPILAGGTGMYFRALFGGLVDITIPKDELARIRAALDPRTTDELYRRLLVEDPARAGELSPNDRVRIARALELIDYTGVPASELYARQSLPSDDIVYLKLVLFRPRSQSRERVAERTRALFAAGWPLEVSTLLAGGVSVDAPAMKGLGYRSIARAIQDGLDPVSCLDAVIVETQRYAKRQETFFRSERDAVWIDVSNEAWEGRVDERVRAFLGVATGRAEPQ
jgi:tRNA dimethylallyltransferase